MNSPFEYQESLNSLHFTEEEKAAIARRADVMAFAHELRRAGPPPCDGAHGLLD